MDLRGLLGRLTAALTTRQRTGRTPDAPTPVARTTADVLWIERDVAPPFACRARLLYTTDPGRADDHVFLSRLAHRLYAIQIAGRQRTRHRRVFDLLSEPIRAGQCLLVPPGFCGGRPVYLHDVAWRHEEAGPDFSLGDLNRSLRALSLVPDSRTPVLEPVSPGDATRRARRRLNLLRARGSHEVAARVVQANGDLFRPGDEDHPAVVLFALPDGGCDELLAGLAERLFEARDSARPPPRPIAGAVGALRAGNTTGWQYHRRVRIGPEATGGREVHLADLWVHREFLKGGRIERPELRCLVEPGDAGGIELLPWGAEAGSPVVLDRAWLGWNGGTIPMIAGAIAAEGRFEDLPILADALEDAGCADREMLAHLREPGPHGGQCWVVDLLRGEG